MAQREELCAAWHALPDELRKDLRLTRLYHALGGPRMEEPAEAVAPVEAPRSRDAAYDMIDRYLRNNLDDSDYAEYSAALEAVYGVPDTGCSAAGGRCEWPLTCEQRGSCAYGVTLPAATFTKAQALTALDEALDGLKDVQVRIAITEAFTDALGVALPSEPEPKGGE
jgi:hypothetical protein